MYKKVIFGSILSIGSLVMAARQPEAPGVDHLFLNRTSPRAMAGTTVGDDVLAQLWEAARWAPSSYNEQPWRFIYAKGGTRAWDTLFDLLCPFNQSWCIKGSVLVVVLSKNDSSHGGLNGTHSYDTGAAWENLALQGSLKNLVVHGMSGFDYEKAREVLHVPEDFTIEAMCVIGNPGDVKDLPEHLRAGEAPSGRKPVDEIVCEGSFEFGE